MNIQPDLLRHPKFLLLRRAVGPSALEYLTRLWGHCQENQRGHKWGKVPPEYVEAVCEWDGKPGELFTALTEQKIPGKLGWIELREDGRVIIHDWDVYNEGLLHAWKIGKLGGRPRGKPSANQQETSRFPRGKPSANQQETSRHPNRRGGEGIGEEGSTSASAPPSREVGWPTLSEFTSYASMIGLPEWKALEEWHYQEKLAPAWKGIGDWKRHAAHVKVRWEQDGRPTRKLAPASKTALSEELEAVKNELQWQSDPVRVGVLKKRRGELESQL